MNVLADNMTRNPLPIIWCATLEEFERKAANRPDSIPVIAPVGEVEQTRRSAILNTFYTAPRFADVNQYHPEDVIVALDEIAERSLRPFAARQGRPLYSVQAFRDVFAHADASQTRSLLVCGHHSQFPSDSIMELNAAARIPWGIFTGCDEADLTFLAAKNLLTPDPGTGSRHHAGVYMAEYVYRVSSHGSPSYEPYSAGAVVRLLADETHDSLTLASHGGAGHLTLGKVRVCNPSHFNIVDTNDTRHVCAIRGTTRQCRRISDPDTVILSFGDIQARSLTAFACSMVTRHQGMYASDWSAFLSVAGGYPNAIITTDQFLALPPRLLDVSVRLAAMGIADGWRVRLMNDYLLGQDGTAPLLLMGDPLGSEPRWGESARTREDGGPPLTIHLADKQPRPKIMASASPNASLLRGSTYLTVLDGEAGVRDMTDEFSHAERWFVALGKRVQEAVRLEQVLALVYQLKHSDAGEELLFDQLAQIRMALEFRLTTALIVLERCEATGTWDQQVNSLREVCAVKVRAWDGICATLMKDFMVGRDTLGLLAPGLRLESRKNNDEPCDFCGAETTLKRYRDRIGGQACATVRSCPRCGEIAYWPDRLGSIRVTVNPTIQSGRRNRVRLALPPSDDDLVEHGWVIWRLFDAGVKQDRARASLQYRVGDDVECEFDEVLTPDIHELTVVAVKDLSLRAIFRSWPAEH
jgi:hypothetical protein